MTSTLVAIPEAAFSFAWLGERERRKEREEKSELVVTNATTHPYNHGTARAYLLLALADAAPHCAGRCQLSERFISNHTAEHTKRLTVVRPDWLKLPTPGL